MYKVACLFLAYRNIDVIRKSLDSIINVGLSRPDEYKLDIYVVENKTEHTDSIITPFLQDYIQRRLINGYLVFDENITNNALELAINGDFFPCSDYDYVIVTDGDLFVPQGTISEQISILTQCPEVYCCGLAVDYKRWSAKNKLEKAANLEKESQEKRQLDLPYLPMPAGFWFVAFKTIDFLALYKLASSNGIRMVDGHYQKLCRLIFRREWVQTKLSIGNELHREGQAVDYDGPVIKKRVIQEFINAGHAEKDYGESLYNHNKFSAGHVYDLNGCRPFPLMKLKSVNPTKSLTYKHDPFVTTSIEIVRDTANAFGRLYVLKKPPKKITPGVYVIQYGVGTSFYLESHKAVFLQMRDGETNPINKGPVGVPPLEGVTFKEIFFDNLLSTVDVTPDQVRSLLTGLSVYLEEDGEIRVALLDWRKLLSVCLDADDGPVDKLIKKLSIPADLENGYKKREDLIHYFAGKTKLIDPDNVFVDACKQFAASSYVIRDVSYLDYIRTAHDSLPYWIASYYRITALKRLTPGKLRGIKNLALSAIRYNKN